ncbi:7752_t:CDS:1, partial [Scutellospora calospora]
LQEENKKFSEKLKLYEQKDIFMSKYFGKSYTVTEETFQEEENEIQEENWTSLIDIKENEEKDDWLINFNQSQEEIE